MSISPPEYPVTQCMNATQLKCEIGYKLCGQGGDIQWLGNDE